MRKLKLLIAAALTMGAAVTADAAKTVYLNPGAWDADDATERYALYMFNSDTENAWVDFTVGTDGIWSAKFDETYSQMIICRMNGNNDVNNWDEDNKWNQTANLAAPAKDGMFYAVRAAGDSPWLSIVDPTPNAGDDMTGAIANSGMTGNANGWTITGQARYFNGNGFDGTASFIELTNWGSSWDATIAQTITNLPNGYYKVRAAGQMSGVADCWMKLVANGKENYFSRNGDTNGNILANGAETAIGSGVAGWRYSTVIAKVTDGTLAISAVGHSDVKERWANVDAFTLTYLGAEIAPNTDVTDFINNWDFWGCFNDAFNGWTIEKTGGNSWVHGNSAVEHWSDDMTRTFDFYQTINDLPEGRYQISASMWCTQGEPNGNSGVYGLSNGVTDFAGVTDDCDDANLHTYTTAGIFVNDGTLRLGVKNNGARSSNWFGVDWIKLNYLGKVVQDYAVALPADGAMAADTWYYFDIAAAADNYNASATSLGDIICTANGNTLTTATAGDVTLTAENNSLEAKRYYVKSASANNLVVAASSFVYEVSEATVDAAYIQPGQTVTVSYTVSTNDPDATLAQDYSGVTLNGAAVACTPTASGFTFTVPAGLAAATAFTLAIPANAIGYAAGNTYNAAKEITLTTPALYDGSYFFRVENETAAKGKYLARGYNYGTHATVDAYGLPINVVTDGQGVTTLQAADTKRYYFHTSSYDCFADGASVTDNSKFTISLVDGKYRIHNNAMNEGQFFKYSDIDVDKAMLPIYDDGNGSNAGPIIEWAIETGAEHAVVMQALKDVQAATNATAAAASVDYASLSGITTIAGLEAELTANYIKGDFVAASEIASVKEIYQNDNTGSQPGNDNAAAKVVYSNTINITKAGFYRFSMQAFYRAGSNEVVQANREAGLDFPPVVLFFGDQETQIKSVYDESSATALVEGWGNVAYNGANYPNNTDASLVMFKNGKYHNDVWFYCPTPGEYTYGVKYQGFANQTAQWFIYSPESVTITSYAAAAKAEDYEALAAAISAYDAATWGFEAGEYAPYNNTVALANIAAAKAINSSETNSKLLVNSLTDDLVLTDNTEEVDAVYDGTFAIATNNGAPLGWTMSNNTLGGDYHSRAFVGDERLSEFNTTNSGLFLRFDGTNSDRGSQYTYGATEGYNMPLKAATTYLVKVDFTNWGTTNEKPLRLNVDGPNSFNVYQDMTSVKDADKGTDAPDQFYIVFTTTEAGNYSLRFQVTGDDENKHNVVISNVTLKKAPSFAVVGCKKGDETDKAIFSGAWDTATTTDVLTFADGVYTKTYTDLTLDKQTIDFKVVKQGAEVTWYPAGMDNNHSINIPVNGKYDITFTFNETTAEITGVAVKTAEAVTIGEKGWATTVTNSALDFSAGEVEAYTATVANNAVTLTKVDDVPAETGLVLKGTANTYYIPVIENSTTEKGSLKFSSIYEYIMTDEVFGQNTFYGLTVNTENKAQFVKLNQGTIPAQKAFLMVPGTSNARTLKVVFAGESTGIDSIAAETVAAEGVYNLNGQRVNAPAKKGLYIVNGKKVILK